MTDGAKGRLITDRLFEIAERECDRELIFDPVFGIKAQANPVTPQARQNLLNAIGHLRDKGAEAVILGCTELPLAITSATCSSMAQRYSPSAS